MVRAFFMPKRHRKMKKMPVQIRFTDIDIFGHVNNARYPELFDTARYLFVKEMLPGFDPNGRSVVLVHLETNFKKQLVLSDEVYVETAVVKVGERSLGMSQRIINEKDASIHADSYSVLSTYDAALQQSFPMPKEWRNRLTEAMNTK